MKENENTSSQKEESATDVLGDTTKSPGLRHFKKILDTKPAIYRCSKCLYEAKLWAVQIHFKHRHSNRRDYVCGECGQGFKTKDKLKRHKTCLLPSMPYTNIPATETKPSHYQCNLCPFKTEHSTSLPRHFKFRHGESRLCKICNTTFRTTESLERHTRRKHQSKNEGDAYEMHKEEAKITKEVDELILSKYVQRLS